ncbi:MAG: alkylphosphonate utilization protein, partial [Magnetococcales bacterium]|nr:alkylphosphonate utilization protein [Magnetococcales bacterium]
PKNKPLTINNRAKTPDIILQDGDTVSLIKDLKVKGSSSVVKVGTKVKINRLVEGDHNIDCKITGIGPMMLKSEFVKKS